MTYRARYGAALVWAITVATAIGSVVLLAMSWDRALTDDVFSGFGGVSFAAMSVAFASSGAIIAVRVSDNAVGRLFLLIGLLVAIGLLGYQYGAYGLSRPGGVPGMATVAWLSNPVSQPSAALIGLSLMLFPNGRLVSPCWRPAAVVCWVAAVLLSVPSLLEPGSLSAPFASLSNPVHIDGIRGSTIAAEMLGWVLAVVGIGLGAASLALRWRRSRGEVRQQLKLVLAVGAVVGAAATLVLLTWFPWPHGGLSVRIGMVGLLLSVFVVAVGVAVTRYRLYEVEVAIERTAVYGALTVLLAGAWAVTAVGLGTALGSDSRWVTAGATLVVAVAFRPLRAALQDLVDRRFSRARYEATQRVSEFLERLRSGQSAPEEIEPLLRGLLSDPELELRFFLPASEVYVDTAGMPVNDDPGDARVRTPVLRAGAPVAMVLHRPTGSQRPDPLVTLVEAGGLAVEIARLRVELRRQLAEVQASRARIVAAGNAERRRIERDLHDGAQQRLVSIGLRLRHAQHELGAGQPAHADETLEQAVTEVALAIDQLRELAHGLPPAQLDAGLDPALRELAVRAPLPVQVHTTPERFSVGLEAAAYFVACEGLTNAIKHSNATGVVLSAQRSNGHLIVRVTDDGVGGAVDKLGGGLRGLHDRVAAHGGSLRVESAPDTGTILTAELPCGS
ncbi:MAG TPA: sensor histidine kinase [Solirubrobacteraceae bacterium]|nr:sensor histidine kinase [Solirubrobacteraceae bacterium]